MDHDLAHRLVAACPDVWAAGMAARASRRQDDYRVVRISDAGAVVAVQGHDHTTVWQDVTRAPLPPPDLDDPATAGILLARLWATCPLATVYRTADGTVAVKQAAHPAVLASGASLAHACAAAIVALASAPSTTE